jgi:long-subunit acyl-CoA synthetase (AMP-forming)
MCLFHFPTLTDEQLRQVLVHSDCQVLFVGKLDAWESMKGGIPTSIRCVSYPSYYEGAPSEFENWESITKITHPLASFALASYEEVSSIVYTSGTTGVPKGVMLTHQGLISALEHTREVGLLDTSNARFFSYLPLCHIAERTLVESAGIASGVRSILQRVWTLLHLIFRQPILPISWLYLAFGQSFNWVFYQNYHKANSTFYSKYPL